MAIELCGRLILSRQGPPSPSIPLHNHRETSNPRNVLLLRNATKPTAFPTRNASPRQGEKQAVTRRSWRLDHAPPPPHHSQYQYRPQNDNVQEERRLQLQFGFGLFGPEMPPLRIGEDASVADWAHGSQDAVQCMWGQVQVGSARARIPTRCEPDICIRQAFQFAPEGSGAPETEGVPEITSASVS